MMPTVDEEFANARFIEIARRYDLNPDTLRTVMYARSKGMNNGEIAEIANVSRNTVNKYVHALNEMDDEDLKTLLFIIAIIGAGAFLLAFASILLKPPGGP